jgi:hypothetical protein
MAVIFVMVDGVGLAPAGDHNPVASEMSGLAGILGVALDEHFGVVAPEVYAAPIDATLGVPGLPQSGSGHTAIYGGFNAAVLNGRHQPSYPTIAMRAALEHHNLLSAARAAGYRVAWANGYLPGYEQAVERRRTRHTAGTWSALSAGLDLRGLDQIMAGTAVTWELTQALARSRPGCGQLPAVDAADAGARLVGLAGEHDLVAFETYLPDLAGHGRLPWSPREALRLVDRMLADLLRSKRSGDTLVVTSDHGNVEDATTRIHTRNPVPLLAHGPAAALFRQVTAIDGVMAAILEGLRV